MNIMKFNSRNTIIIAAACAAFILTGCKKYLDNTQLPAGTIAGDDAFISDNSISAIVTGNFLGLNSSGPFNGSASSNLAYMTGLYTDELKPISTTSTFPIPFYTNVITSSNITHWANLYGKIYVVNGALEGIRKTTALLYYKNQWLGESYFVRGLLYFYLVNEFGDVPLALSTDYTANNALSRSPQSQVYQQIIADLRNAQGLLSTDYKDGYGSTTTFRVRPNRTVATALMAKVYLYNKQYDSAEVQ